MKRLHTTALSAALAWMCLGLVAASAAADAGLLTRAASLLHWLAVGVLPPALALASLPPER